MSARLLCGFLHRLSFALVLLLPCAAAPNVRAEEVPGAPLPRLETGMHTAVIKRIAADAMGRWAVTVSEDKTARIWELSTGKLLRVLRPPQGSGNEGKLYSAAMSPDGSLVAVGGWTQFKGGRGEAPGYRIYLLDRASGHLLRRIGALPSVINHLAWSPDGRWLAASVGATGGVHVFKVANGAETGRDTDYGDDSYSVHFSADGQRLVTTSYDGRLRLYAVAQGTLRRLAVVTPLGDDKPYAARFSPDGRLVAVSYRDKGALLVLDAGSLALVARPDVSGIDGNLSSIAWSDDGRQLYAGGPAHVSHRNPVRRWQVGSWSRYDDIPVANDTLTDLAPLPGGKLLFATAEPTWGVLDRDGRLTARQASALADFRDQRDFFGLSADARRVRFGYDTGGAGASNMDVPSRALGADDPSLASARTQADGLRIEHWKNDERPTLNGRPLALNPGEQARSLAISADGQRFVLGTDWSLRMYDRAGELIWSRDTPGAAWDVNLSQDGRFVVAGYGDGSIRWHLVADGAPVLAFFPHADRKRWIAWTPEGFYTASGPDAEALMGYHLNRGADREGEFVSARQLREIFYQPGLISARLDAQGDALMAGAVSRLGDVRKLLAGNRALPPEVELLSPGETTGNETVTVKVRVKDQGGGIGDLVFYVDGQPDTGRQAGPIGADRTASRTFTLPPGKRRIEVAARTPNGVEGSRRLVLATLTGPSRDTALHILAVGVEHYQQPDLALGYSVADAQSIADEFATRAKPLFRRGVTRRVLRDDEASLAGIERAFADIRTRLQPQDTLVIFLAGHGEAPIGKGYTFLPWDFRRGAAGDAGEGLSEARLRRLMAGAPAQTLLLLDTCDAGGAVEMMEGAYDRLNNVSKQVVIGASRRFQLAREGFEGHGVFTAALLHVLQSPPRDEADRLLRVTDLRADVDREVRRILRTMGASEQQRVSGFLGSADFPLVMR
ncbi:caspase family protein [Niveibacterium sp. SC-1]|uniref:caspase family protein n=1 Tax=Niveibacterium sp. SC-1 TaxID=3135646 RepID=UPI00311E9837